MSAVHPMGRISFSVFRMPISRINSWKMRNYPWNGMFRPAGRSFHAKKRDCFCDLCVPVIRCFSPSHDTTTCYILRNGSLLDSYKTTIRRNSSVNHCTDRDRRIYDKMLSIGSVKFRRNGRELFYIRKTDNESIHVEISFMRLFLLY